MHAHFYHWHTRAELRPETDILGPRWDAAQKFAENVTAADICSLLRLALFTRSDTAFASHFGEELVKLEPTFPTTNNLELLRVMATASLYGLMDSESEEADAVALGLQAAAYPVDRISPVCKELMERASQYLIDESERLRPATDLRGKFHALRTITSTSGWEQKPDATKAVGESVLEMGEAIKRISEENQFSWWILGRQSSVLKKRREMLTTKEYAFIVAIEAAARMTSLPPPPSVDALITEALTHCKKPSNDPVPLAALIETVNKDSLNAAIDHTAARQLVPVTILLSFKKKDDKVETAAYQDLGLPLKLQIPPAEAAIQYFHELAFLKALSLLS